MSATEGLKSIATILNIEKEEEWETNIKKIKNRWIKNKNMQSFS